MRTGYMSKNNTIAKPVCCLVENMVRGKYNMATQHLLDVTGHGLHSQLVTMTAYSWLKTAFGKKLVSVFHDPFL